MEEVVARNVLIDQRPDALLNIIDATNLERNLYLTTQLAELGIPMVVALNMMDVVRKNGDRIDAAKLSNHLGVPVVEISALKGDGVMEAAQRAVQLARSGKKTIPQHRFAGSIEHALGAHRGGRAARHAGGAAALVRRQDLRARRAHHREAEHPEG